MKHSFDELYRLVNLIFKVENQEETNNRTYIHVHLKEGVSKDGIYKDNLGSVLRSATDKYKYWSERGEIVKIEIFSYIDDILKKEIDLSLEEFDKVLDQASRLNSEIKGGDKALDRIAEIAKINAVNVNDISTLYKSREISEYKPNELGGQYVINGKQISLFGFYNDLHNTDLLSVKGDIKARSIKGEVNVKVKKAEAEWQSMVLLNTVALDKEIAGLKAKQFKITAMSDGQILLSKMVVPSSNGSESFVVEVNEKQYYFQNLSTIFRDAGFKSASSKETESIYFIKDNFTARISSHCKNEIEYDDENGEWTLTIRVDKEQSSYSVIRKVFDWTDVKIQEDDKLKRQIKIW